MKKELDIDSWERKPHYEFFKGFDEPFFGACVDISCGKAYQKCKENGWSFFLYYLHKTLVVVNAVENFRYRTDGEKVWVYKKVHATPTVLRDNKTFGFSYMDYHKDFKVFQKSAQEEIAKVKEGDDLVPAEPNSNVIHFSSLPWLDFSSFSHARHFKGVDSCPKISFGKMTGQDGQLKMPVSIHVHHALMDGYHVGQFVEKLQALMDE